MTPAFISIFLPHSRKCSLHAEGTSAAKQSKQALLQSQKQQQELEGTTFRPNIQRFAASDASINTDGLGGGDGNSSAREAAAAQRLYGDAAKRSSRLQAAELASDPASQQPAAGSARGKRKAKEALMNQIETAEIISALQASLAEIRA